jgi:hypothetical protein
MIYILSYYTYVYINRPFSIATCDTGGDAKKNKNRSRTVHWLSRDVFVVFLDMDLAYGASARVRGSGPPGFGRPGGILEASHGIPGLVNIQKTDGKDPPCY